ncbi:MAG: hypothetical protein M5U12_05760 [Verrucomicrobia bacterium]|nr:hypothetical protein [Verrucomicrobiota bacterium]
MRRHTPRWCGWVLMGLGGFVLALQLLIPSHRSARPVAGGAPELVSPRMAPAPDDAEVTTPDCPDRDNERTPTQVSAESALAAELDRLLDDPVSEAREDALYSRLEAWTAEAPGAAATWAADVAATRGRSTCLAVVLSRWGRTDPEAVIEWAHASLAGSLRDFALWTAAQQWAASDARAAVRVLHELGDDRLRQQTAVLVAMRWFPQEPEAACAWAEELSAGPLADAVWCQIALASAASDPARAARLAVTRLTPGPEQDRAIVGVIQRWAQSDPGSRGRVGPAVPRGSRAASRG